MPAQGIAALQRNAMARPSRPRRLAHQGEKIILRIAKERHPQIVVRHFGDEMRRALKFHLAPGKLLIGVLNVRNLEIDNRTGMIELRLFGEAEHQPDAAAVEKRHPGNGEQMPQAEPVAVKRHGALEIMHGNSNLADAGKGGFRCCHLVLLF